MLLLLCGMLQSSGKSLLVCVADSYHSLNSELCAEYFYYVTCHVCMLRVLYRYCRAPCRALSMKLEPWSKKWPTRHVAVPTGENRLKFRPSSAAGKVTIVFGTIVFTIVFGTNNHV